MHPFRCSQCQTTVFFENDHCGVCGAALGFVPGLQQMLAFAPPGGALVPGASGTAWPVSGGSPPAAALRPCANRLDHGVCNWMLDDGDLLLLCRSCRLTQLLPALDIGRNRQRWQAIEQAKRRLLFTLLGLGMMPEPKTGPGDAQGLRYVLLEDLPGQEPVQTGHDSGTITLNVAEADDDWREAQRVRLREPMRTLLGHLRHETAHWLQQRWIDNMPAAERCRAVFGDERADYGAALATHYAQGAPANWPEHFISAYAAAHPWEDWAETCAHWLLVLDAVQTASAWGLRLQGGPAQAMPHSTDLARWPDIERLVLQQWLPVSQFLNAMNRCLGRGDSYPFLIPPEVLHKMATVQALLHEASRPATRAPASAAGSQDDAAAAGSLPLAAA